MVIIGLILFSISLKKGQSKTVRLGLLFSFVYQQLMHWHYKYLVFPNVRLWVTNL